MKGLVTVLLKSILRLDFQGNYIIKNYQCLENPDQIRILMVLTIYVGDQLHQLE